MPRDKAIEHPPIKRFQKLRKRASHMRHGRSPQSCLDTMILAASAALRCRAISHRFNIPDSCGTWSGGDGVWGACPIHLFRHAGWCWHEGRGAGRGAFDAALRLTTNHQRINEKGARLPGRPLHFS